MKLNSKGYDFKHHFITIDKYRYHYIDEGQGTPILMLHGNPTWSFYYRNLIHQLRSHYRCIAVDHIGCGMSDKPSSATYSYTLAQHIENLSYFIKTLNLCQPLHLLMHDWGGAIGMGYAVKHPQQIKSIVLFNTFAFHIPKQKSAPWQLQLARTPIGAWMILYGNYFARAAARVCCQKNKMPKHLRDDYCAPYNSPSNRIATLEFVRDIPVNKNDRSYDTLDYIDKHLHLLKDKPTLICWGDKDFVFDQHFLNQWQHYFPHAEVHQFADCGHYICEDAKQEVNQIVENFIAGIEN